MVRIRFPMLWSAILAVVAIVLLSGCGTSAGATVAPAPAALAGTRWTLTRIEQGGAEQPIVQGAQLTLQFDNGTVSGKAACNSFSGTYVVTGQSLTISDLRQTLMACEAPLMQLEDSYSAALDEAQSFALQGTTLKITYGGGTLSFTRA
jgi:heat shock protein HslJ